MLEPEVDARARSRCSSQKWMLVPGLDAMRERGLRNLPKGDDYRGTDWSRRLYSLGDPYLESKLQKSNPRVDMVQSTSTSQLHPPRQGNPLRPNLGLNASRGPRPATEHRKTNRPRRKWQAAQDEEIQKGKELRVQNWAKRRERLNKLSALNPEVSKALDMKECMLEVQGILLGKLAAEENRLKGLVEDSGPPIANFDERVQEVEEVIRSMQY